MSPSKTVEMEDLYRLGVYPKRDVVIVKGDGCRLWDENGKEYLDFGANYGVCNVGHCNPQVTAAINNQLKSLMYASPTYYNPVRAELLGCLAELTPGDLSRTFLCNSGTEAVETAFKIARWHTKRQKIVAAKRGYHGRTLGALAATWNPSYREAGGIEVPGYSFVTYGDIEDLRREVDNNTAAVILEPVQGEGGVNIPPSEYLAQAQSICKENGALLIADEIQTGLGRTGRMFAVSHYDVVPDIMCLAKSLGGGLPIGAAIAKPEVCTLPVGAHGSTFGGNPVACAAALAVLDYIAKNDLSQNAARTGGLLLDGLEKVNADVIREVRGLGLMIGIELKKKAGGYLTELLKSGLIALPAGSNVIRLLPPLVIDEEQIDFGLKLIKKVLEDG